MATIAVAPTDQPYVVGVATTFSTYPTNVTATASAATLVAGNSSLAYYVCEVIEQVTAPGRVDLVPGNPGPTTWFLYAQGGTTYYPLATATTAAYTTSAANSNAATYVAVGRLLVTGP